MDLKDFPLFYEDIESVENLAKKRLHKLYVSGKIKKVKQRKDQPKVKKQNIKLNWAKPALIGLWALAILSGTNLLGGELKHAFASAIICTWLSVLIWEKIK